MNRAADLDLVIKAHALLITVKDEEIGSALKRVICHTLGNMMMEAKPRREPDQHFYREHPMYRAPPLRESREADRFSFGPMNREGNHPPRLPESQGTIFTLPPVQYHGVRMME